MFAKSLISLCLFTEEICQSLLLYKIAFIADSPNFYGIRNDLLFVLCFIDLYFLFLKAALLTFATFVATSNEPLTAERAFVTLSLFNILRFPLGMLPFQIPSVLRANVSLNDGSLDVSFKRLTAFLLYDEINPDNLETREQPASGMYYSDVNIK